MLSEVNQVKLPEVPAYEGVRTIWSETTRIQCVPWMGTDELLELFCQSQCFLLSRRWMQDQWPQKEQLNGSDAITPNHSLLVNTNVFLQH